MLFQNLLHLFYNSEIDNQKCHESSCDYYMPSECITYEYILPSFTGFSKKKSVLQVTVKNGSENIFGSEYK